MKRESPIFASGPFCVMNIVISRYLNVLTALLKFGRKLL
jgi:hypothetical protein